MNRPRTLASRRPSTLTRDQRWDAALADFADTMGRAKLAASTVDRVTKHLRKFATETGAAPFDVRAPLPADWLAGLDCTDRARHNYGTSLRTFYRWAHRAGRVVDNPTARSGPHPLARTIPDTWGDTLAAFRRWQRAAGVAVSTQDLYAHRLNALARETGAASPWDLTTDDLADWLAGHRWARETTRSTRTALRAFYGWAYDLGHLDDNPAHHLPRVRAATPVPRPASEDAYRQALADADDRTALLVRLAADLGLRRAETARVHTRDLHRDADGTWWLIVHGKGDRTRRLPLSRGLATLLRDRPAGYVFPNGQGGHLTPSHVGVLVSRVLPEGTTMHALRHRFATRAYSIDRDVFTVQQLLGHARADTTQRYVQVSGADMRRLVESVSG